MRLIDADALKAIRFHDLPYSQIVPADCDTDEKVSAYKLGWNDAIDAIVESAPRVDPVKHGHWTSSQGIAEVGEVQCSNCKTIYYADDLYNVGETDENGIGQALMPNYCPHCGAYMGVEDGKI